MQSSKLLFQLIGNTRKNTYTEHFVTLQLMKEQLCLR